MQLNGRASLAFFLVLAACQSQEPSVPPPLVRSMIVTPAAVGGMRYAGTIRAEHESDLAFQVTGRIVERMVDAGARVEEGQPLLRLDPADLVLAATGATDRRRAAEAKVTAMRAEAERAIADEARQKGLVEAGAVSAQSYDRTRAASAAARAALAAAEAEAAAARGAADIARNQSDYGVLRAPSAGIVGAIFGEPGQVVAAGTPVIRLAAAGRREALIAVPEDQLKGLPRTGTATVYGDGGRSYAVQLREIAGSADPATRTYAARYRLVGGEALPVGSSVTIALGGATGRLGVPLSALHDPGSGPGVWVIGRDAKVHFRKVAVAAYDDDLALISSGINPGERIVALGAHLLKEGEKVRLERAAQDRAQAAR